MKSIVFKVYKDILGHRIFLLLAERLWRSVAQSSHCFHLFPASIHRVCFLCYSLHCVHRINSLLSTCLAPLTHSELFWIEPVWSSPVILLQNLRSTSIRSPNDDSSIAVWLPAISQGEHLQPEFTTAPNRHLDRQFCLIEANKDILKK